MALVRQRICEVGIESQERCLLSHKPVIISPMVTQDFSRSVGISGVSTTLTAGVVLPKTGKALV
jgi:hypothetical protein